MKGYILNPILDLTVFLLSFVQVPFLLQHLSYMAFVHAYTLMPCITSYN